MKSKFETAKGAGMRYQLSFCKQCNEIVRNCKHQIKGGG